ncbi:MAG: Ig-like domain-containing protein [bacterium]|nr:MAG: Ig-like domain-containing protein [bacterium]
MKLIKLLTLFVLILAVAWNCDSPTNNDSKIAVLSGQVLDGTTLNPIANAGLVVLDFPEISGLTNNDGFFKLEIETEVSLDIQLRVFKDGYFADTLALLAVPGNTISNIAVILQSRTPVTQPSGSAASIVLFATNPSSIGVRESGAPEVSEITFQVQDSSGIPVDLDNSVQVNFAIGSSPGEGEFISPTSGVTASGGLVKTSLFSGTKAGVVQLIATIDVGSSTIISKPVAIAIHGGLPDSTHFSLAVEKLNFPGYNIYGLTDKITAFVGDKYSNPVRPGTAVYFNTTGGLIEGSALTSLTGQASVNLISAAPQPIHPVFGAGFATIKGTTVNERQEEIAAYAIVLFSGIPQITVNPTAINVPDGGAQSFSFRVHDQNFNPLASGTTISVVVEAGDIEAVGNTNVTLPDTQNDAWTFFGFSLVDVVVADTLPPVPASVKISTTGPNGNLEYSIFGSAD